ncbi:HNH endonuclease [Kitasatospora sp. NPDC048407]|uniref:HNH endonuclease n=1 Tax=Kitasatospora sp. NPDC048407 TaxID=3364051 RepID=UPI0037100C8A
MSDVVMRGPLRDIARRMQTQSGVDAEDAYAAALCWWSAAVAPVVNRAAWWPCLVWGAFLTRAGRPPMLAAALESAGLEPGRPGKFSTLTLHPDVTTETGLRAAHSATARRTRPDTAFSMLLTGSPIKYGALRTSADEFLASALRRAWDGRDYRSNEERRRLSSLGLAGHVPRIGVLWEMPECDWRHDAQLDPASSTRVLIFKCRDTRPVRATDHQVRAAAEQSVEELARIYDGLAARQVDFDMTGEAAEKLDLVRAAEDLFDSQAALPESQFLRLGDHTLRIAAALALAEDTDVTTGEHLDAAWSVVARSCRDRVWQLCPDGQDLASSILDATSTGIAAVTGSPEALSRWDPSPARSTDTDAGNMPVRAVRGRNGKIRRDTAVGQEVKGWYGNQCQMCGTVLRIPGPRQAVSEGAHIRPLGKGGHDYTGNVLCLCPNCHVQFDQGGLYLDDDLRVIEAVTGTARRSLAAVPQHVVDLEYVQWHREWHRESEASAAGE